MPEEQDHVLTNRRLCRYRIGERLGIGGMGEVYQAEDLELVRPVALKFPSCGPIDDSSSRERLVQEARAAATLNHPNIATIYEVGLDDERPFIAMEYVEGETLAATINNRQIEITAILDIAIQLADALKTAHGRGVIHRDLKSSNIMVTKGGGVKVLDFGLAMAAGASDNTPKGGNMTEPVGPLSEPAPPQEVEISGTPVYMSPEQVRGERLDVRADIFSLGVVLYEIATGHRPFEGRNRAESLHATLTVEPPPLSHFRDDVPLELEGIVRKALEKDREQRYSSADAVLSDLEQVRSRIDAHLSRTGLRDAGASSLPERDASLPAAPPERTPRSWTDLLARRRKWLLTLAALAVLLAAVDRFALGRQTGIDYFLLLGFAGTAALGYALLRPAPAHQDAPLPKGAAFRGLVPFHEADRDRFYGREIDTSALFERITHADFRFGVLYGESGCGKTSLLRAGLLPKLWDTGHVPVYCRSYKELVATLLEECQKRFQINPGKEEDPVDYLRRLAQELDSDLVVTYDQFEEFFVTIRSQPERESFISFVGRCHNDATLPVKFLFSIRSDFLYLIGSEFSGQIDEPLLSTRLFHLRNFDCRRAEEIIERSARAANLLFEPGLSARIARDLAVHNTVLPSELQIVGMQLQNRRIFNTRDYQRAGGKEQLVYSYVEDVIESSGHPETARLLLRSLVSEENTRITLSLQEIARRTETPRDVVRQTLNYLAQSRLVREIQEEEPWRYELMHEYLIEKIHQITGKLMDATQRANRLFRQYLSNYSTDKGARIPLAKLRFIRRYSDLERGERERELLARSLRSGLARLSLFCLVLSLAALLAAAALSERDEWEVAYLRDGHTAAARQASFSPDGRMLVSGGGDGAVIVWDFQRRERLATFNENRGQVRAVCFSPDGKWFAAGSADGSVSVWDAAGLAKAADLRDSQGAITAVAFTPDARGLISVDKTTRAVLWNVGRWDKAREMPFGFEDGTIVFLPHGRLFNTLGQCWDWTTGERLSDCPYETSGTNYAALSPDGTKLVTVSSGNQVGFLDTTKRRPLGSPAAHQDHGRAVAFSPDGQWVASGSDDIVLWDPTTRKMLSRLEYSADVWSLVFSPNNRWLISTHGDGAVLLWDVMQRRRAANLSGHSAPVNAIAFSPDGKLVASAGDDHSVILWDAERRSKKRRCWVGTRRA